MKYLTGCIFLHRKNKQAKKSFTRIKKKLAHKKEIFAFKFFSLATVQNHFTSKLAQEIGFVGILGDLVSVQKNAPREIFHFFDRFFSCVIFSYQKELPQIIKILETLKIHSLEMIFLDAITPPAKSSSQDSFSTQLQFSKKTQEQEIAQKDLESLKCFFSSIVSFQTLPLKSETHPFSSPNICSSFPNLLEYKDTKNLTHSEKYSSHLDSLSALETQLDTMPKKLDMLNSNIKKLQTDIQTQNSSLENLESTSKKSQADISVANEKYWQLKNHVLNESKKIEQQKNLKQQREITQNQLLQEEIATAELEKKRADLQKEIQFCTEAKESLKQKRASFCFNSSKRL